MLKRPLLIFAVLTGVLIASSILFLQSRTFARMTRDFLSESIPPGLGISGNFEDFGIRLFPPAVSVRKPELKLEPKNLFSLPADSVVRAERIDLRFRPVQMLTGRVLVDEIRIVGGDIELGLSARADQPAPRRGGKGVGLDWDRIVQVQVLGVGLEDSRISLQWKERNLSLDIEAKDVLLSRNDSKRRFELDASIPSLVLVEGDKTRQVADLSLRSQISQEGIQIERLAADFGDEDFEFLVSTSGSISGSVLDIDSLKADLAVQARGEFESLAPWLGLSAADSASGELGFDGRVRADLLRLADTLTFDGKISLLKGGLMGWSVDKAEATARLESEGNLSRSRIAIRDAEIQLQDGGELQLGSFNHRLGGRDSIQIPLTLRDAPLSRLLGPHAGTVDNLEVSWSGTLGVEIVPDAKRWMVRAKPDLKAKSLSLHGKGKKAESNLILRARAPSIRGAFVIQRGSFTPEQLEIGFEKSRFNISGAIQWSGKGMDWNLVAAGQTDLSDLDSLARTKILGRGTLSTRIHGKGDSIDLDFDADLEEAEYIRLHFGKLRGRFSLTEQMQKLTFHSVQGRSGGSNYVVNGPIDFRGDGRMEVTYDFPSGRAEDFLKILAPMTSQLPGFPQSLKGRLRTRGTLGGTLSFGGMEITAEVDGGDWSLLGERIRAVKFRGGLQAGRFWADDLVAIKRSGSLLGRISYGSDGRMDWSFRSQNFSLRDFDWIIRVDVPVNGELSLLSDGSGKWEHLDSKTLVRLKKAAIRGEPLADSELQVITRDGSIHVEGSGLGGQARLIADHDPRPGSANSVLLQLSGCDFSSALSILNPQSAQESTLAGRITGGISLQYKGSAIEQASGRLELREFLASKKGARFVLGAPVSAEIRGGTFALEGLHVRSDSGQALHLELGAQKGEWRTAIHGVLDLAALEFVLPMIEQGKGGIELDLNLSGPIWSPVLSGKGEIRSGFLRVSGLDSPLENIAGRVNVRQGRWTFSGIGADLAQGRVQGGGQVQLYTDRFPELDIQVQLAENRLKVYPFQFIKVRTGKIRVSGDQFPYDITGSLAIDSGLSREKLANAGGGIALKSSRYAPPPSAENAIDFPKFKLKIDVSADSGLRFQNEFLDVEMKAQVSLVNTINAPGITGKAELVPGQGKLNFKEHVFQIQNATVILDNPTVINPRFDVGAVTEISGTKIQLYAAGTGDRYKIDLSSNPVMPESEILSLLALGRTSEDSQRLRSANVSGMQQSEAASLILHSMDFNRDVQEKTGIQIGLGEATDTAAGNSIFRPQADAESVSAPKLVLKRKIGKRMDVSVGTTVGAGTTNQREVNADYYLSPSVSVRGVWNYLEGASTQDAGSSQQGRTSYGLDLKVQKRFK